VFTPLAMRQLLGTTCLPQRATANDIIQDEQHVIFQCTHPQVVSAENLLYSLRQDLMMCLLSKQNNN